MYIIANTLLLHFIDGSEEHELELTSYFIPAFILILSTRN